MAQSVQPSAGAEGDPTSPPARRSPRPPSLARRGRARRRVDRAARPHHRLLRHRRDQRAIAGRPAAQRRVRQRDRVQERLHRRSHPRRDRRGHLHGDERDLHPAGGGRADRHLEHGRHDPHRGGLRDQAAEPDLVLCHQRGDLRVGRHGHRQLLDHRGDPGGRLRRDGQRARASRGDRRRGGDLRLLLRRQDDPVVRDHHPGPTARRPPPHHRAAHPQHGLDRRPGARRSAWSSS